MKNRKYYNIEIFRGVGASKSTCALSLNIFITYVELTEAGIKPFRLYDQRSTEWDDPPQRTNLDWISGLLISCWNANETFWCLWDCYAHSRSFQKIVMSTGQHQSFFCEFDWHEFHTNLNVQRQHHTDINGNVDLTLHRQSEDVYDSVEFESWWYL